MYIDGDILSYFSSAGYVLWFDAYKYSPEIKNVQAFERDAWKTGIPVTNGKSWKVKSYDSVIGAASGKETKYVRIEMSGGTIHGHPISESE